MSILAFGSAIHFPCGPQASRSAPIDIGDPDGDRRDRGLDVLHRVVDGQAGVDGAVGGVDVEGDVFVGVLGLEMQQLGDRQVGELVIDRAADEDDPFVVEG
jgi:hypothetical protein